MKFSSATLLGMAAAAPFGTQAFQPATPAVRTLSSSPTVLYSTTEKQSGMSKKKGDRLSFMKNERFHRRGFKEVRDQVEASIQEQYQSPLVNDMKESNYLIEKDGVKVYLAKVGFFWILYLALRERESSPNPFWAPSSFVILM
jgi:4-hydroxy-3-methylbut-2-enyl diphosphate reductase